ncbi:MAG: ABC transporter permease [Anaerolineaceae bacterium]|nr:ABC transporter permease [Anaerolineaceae bacterium]
MRFFDLLKLIVDNLGRRKGRVLLTAIGVVIGTAAVVLLVSLASGLQQNATSQLTGIGDLTTISVYPGYDEVAMSGGAVRIMSSGGGGGGGADSGVHLLTPDAMRQIQGLPGVVEVIPRDYLMTEGILRFGRLQSWASIVGVGTQDLSVFGYPVQSGVTQLSRGTAIIGGWALKNFFDPNQRPGQEAPGPPDLLDQQVRLVLNRYTQDGQMVSKTVNLRVVGVLAEARAEQDNYLFVSMDDLTAWNEWAMGQRINRNKQGYNQMYVKVEDIDYVLDVADQINNLGFMASTPQSYVNQINSFFVIMQIIFGGVGAIALLVAAIGIANTMTMAILERTREIGLMKAIGATNRDVLSIFLGEAAGIGFLGGLGGVILGWVSGQMLNVVAIAYMANQATETGAPPPATAVYTPAWLPLFALVFATLVGLLSGLYPALRAATLVPVAALKYE